MRNYHSIQSKMKVIGDYGCYLLSIAQALNYQGDIVEFYDKCLERGFIDKECTILKPEEICYLLTGEKYKCTKEKKLPSNYTFAIECWKNNRTGLTHFRLVNGFDTLTVSITVLEGQIDSYRVFTRVA